ncbi:hypothetical protein Acj9p033 [Acinetobacter phage Acj9]|uniref:Uncharacterized protein n=1 Tax=Acinetobacter phage Acj9 TaxID=760939 RepID=E5EPG7_9CAUD|nr:hypothetical protein Acj9p033 [Acinetobacter phage Acj9]ADG59933.1 conserved hypothetical protein [Acinetobacter phage Acj9]
MTYTNLFTPAKFVKMSLVGVDGNAFAIMGTFSRLARRQGWTQKEIDAVIEQCKKGNYDDLICTIMAHIEDPE